MEHELFVFETSINRDWRIKDKIIIITNTLNKRKLRKSNESKLLTTEKVKTFLRKYAKKYKKGVYDSVVEIKNKISENKNIISLREVMDE